MAIQYTKDQYWKLYAQLPQELKEAVFSNETAEHISTSCERHKVAEENIPRVASEVGNVLMGVTMPRDFQQALEKEVALNPVIAQDIAQEINRFVFFPVKGALEELHRVPAEKAEHVGVSTPRHDNLKQSTTPTESEEDDYIVKEESPEPKQPKKEVVARPKSKEADQYRESPE